ncbi:O-antigen ligase family protein [Terrabacter terrigena]|uniref:O-antigen ligase family protein n=1 Tax=Terrabacter terrigena TaxID=574718 RepID=A0ABW3MVG7_9MICO
MGDNSGVAESAKARSFGITAVVVSMLIALQVNQSFPLGTSVVFLGVLATFGITRSLEQALLVAVVAQVVFPNVVLGAATYAFGVPALLFWIRGRGKSRVPRPIRSPLALGVVASVAVTLLTAITSFAPDMGVMWRLFALVALTAVLYFRLRSRGDASELAKAAVFALGGVAVVYLVQRGAVLGASGSNSWALAAPVDEWLSRNSLVVLFIIGLIDRLDAVLSSPRSIANVGMCLIFGLSMLVTFSRSGYVAGALAVIALLALHGRRRFFLAMPLAAWFIPWPESVMQRIEYTSSSGGLDPSSAARVELWNAAWSIAIDNPLLGVGVHSLSTAFGQYGVAGDFLYAHNSYLTLAASLGLALPLILAVGAVVFLWRRRASIPPRVASFLVAIAAVSWFGEPLLAAPVLVLVLVVCVTSKSSEGECL